MDTIRKLQNSKRAYLTTKCLQLAIQVAMEVLCALSREEQADFIPDFNLGLLVLLVINGLFLFLNIGEIISTTVVFKYKNPTFKLESMWTVIFILYYTAFLSLIWYYINSLLLTTQDFDAKLLTPIVIIRLHNYFVALIVLNINLIISGIFASGFTYIIRHLENQVGPNLRNLPSYRTPTESLPGNELNADFVADLQARLMRLSNALVQQSNQTNLPFVSSSGVAPRASISGISSIASISGTAPVISTSANASNVSMFGSAPIHLENDLFSENFSDQVLLGAENGNNQNTNRDQGVEDESGLPYGETQAEKVNLLPKTKAPLFHDNPAFDRFKSKSKNDLTEENDDHFEYLEEK